MKSNSLFKIDKVKSRSRLSIPFTKRFDQYGENRIETEPLKRAIAKSPENKAKKKRRPISSPEKRMNGLSSLGIVENRCSTPSAFTNASTVTTASHTSTITAPVKMEVKTERLSPASGMTDNNSSGSGSNTPSSSYPETPPGVSNAGDRIPSPSLSPAAQLSHPKMTDQPMARNYSDMIRSLAAKYNNSNPNDYFNSPKNGLSFGDPRFTPFKSNAASPFAGLVSPLRSGNNSPPSVSCHLPMATTNTKDSNDTDLKHILNATEAQNSLFSTFGLNSFGSPAVPGVNLPLFPPLVDMNSTHQALLNMVRNASSGSVNQLESFIKGASCKRPSEPTSNPLDLSSSVPPSKKPKRPSCSSSESFSSDASTTHHQRAKDHHRVQIKRSGSESPKPPAKSMMFSVPSTQQPLDHRSGVSCLSICTSSLDQSCPSREGVENISNWSIDDVHNFVSSIDVCAEYADNFREQSVDGISLPLLTEEHLRTTMKMKLGPALKFRALLAQKIGHCTVCMHCLHCHGGTGTGTNGHSSLTPIPSNSPSSNATNVRPNSTGH